MNEPSQPVCLSANNSIAIELLRTGTPHNQTLSPGITYMALCGDQPPTDFRIELEQYKFVRYLELLRYKAGTSGVPIQLAREALQDIITKIFEGIPALQAKASGDNGWLHLRLVMSPRELVMLPFELALTPTGLQGARDKPFLLNPQRLTTVTREVRQVAPKTINWPAKPRILFAWANPEQSVPAAENLAKLKEALLPWVCPDEKNTTPTDDYAPLLTELANATFAQLQAKVAEGVSQKKPYTHIHILAHGTPVSDLENGLRYVLALHLETPRLKPDGTKTQTDAVDGSRLADALRFVDDNRLYSPSVVTIAACDGGNDGGNLFPGGSLAHVLHQAGIPYVLASQFPLSKDGSVQLVGEFYPRLLLGEDPRTALYYTRKAIYRPDIHDWASLVAYARFPNDFDDQLDDIQLKITLEIMRAANAWTDYSLHVSEGLALIDQRAEDKLTYAITRLEKLLGRNKTVANNPARLAEHLGLLGSAYKRLAEYYDKQSKRTGAEPDTLLKKSRTALEQARTYYQQGHDLMLANHWTGVQYLSLTAILTGTLLQEHDRWCVILFAAEKDRLDTSNPNRIWASGTLAELYLLQPLTVKAADLEAEWASAIEKASFYLDEVDKSDFAFAKESTSRQLERYINWWPEAYPSDTTIHLQKTAKALIGHLPPLQG